MPTIPQCDWFSLGADCDLGFRLLREHTHNVELPVVVVWLILVLVFSFLFSVEELYRRWFRYRGRFKRLIAPLEREAADAAEVDAAVVNRVGEVLTADALCEHGWNEFKETLVADESGSGTRIYNTRKAEEFFSEEEIVSRSMHPRFFRAVPGLLTSIGLLATFVAILLGLGQLEYTDNRIEGIDGFINALSAKFASSVIALTLAIGFTLMETRVLQRAHLAYQKFCQVLDSVFPRKTAEELLVSLRRDSAEQLAAFQHFNTDLSARFRQGVSEGLGPVLERISQGLMSLTGERDSNIEAMMERLTEEFRKAMTQSAGVELGQIGTTLEQASQLIATANAQTEHTLASFERLVASMNESQGRQENNSRQQEAVMTQLLQKMIQSIEQISNESQSAVGDTVRGLVEQTGSHSQKVNTELRTLLEEHRSSTQSVEQMRAALERTLTLWNESAEQMRKTVAPLLDTSSQLQTASAGLGAAAKEIDKGQQQLVAILSNAQRELGRLQQMGATNERLLTEHERVFQTVQAGLGGMLTTIAEKLGTLQEVSGRGLTKQLQEFDNHLGTATKKLGASVDELSEILDEAAETMKGTSAPR